MKTIQEIFNTVINSGVYPQKEEFMCCALDECIKINLISESEADFAQEEIRKYIKAIDETDAMSICLRRQGIAYGFGSPELRELMLRIYSDWSNKAEIINSELQKQIQ